MIKSVLIGFGIAFLLFVAILYILRPWFQAMNERRRSRTVSDDDLKKKPH